MKIKLYYSKENNTVEVDESNVINELYYNLAILSDNEMRDYISRLNYKIPLFDY